MLTFRNVVLDMITGLVWSDLVLLLFVLSFTLILLAFKIGEYQRARGRHHGDRAP